MLKSKICKNCQQEFQTDYNEQFCSDECRKEFRAKYSAEYMRIRRRNASGVKDFGVALEKKIINGVINSIYDAFMKGKMSYETLEQFLNIEDPREAMAKWYETRDELKCEEDPLESNTSVKNEFLQESHEVQNSPKNELQKEEEVEREVKEVKVNKKKAIELTFKESATSKNTFLQHNEFKVESITKTIHTNRITAPCSFCFKNLKESTEPFYVFKILTRGGSVEELLCGECFSKRYPMGIIDKYPYDTYLVPARRESISKFLQEDTIPYQEILDYLNKRTKRDFRLTEKHRELIKTRWNECLALGLTPEQTLQRFKKVIDVKYDAWSYGSMETYLRPITLFGTKFESYANEKSDEEWKQLRVEWGWEKADGENK